MSKATWKISFITIIGFIIIITSIAYFISENPYPSWSDRIDISNHSITSSGTDIPIIMGASEKDCTITEITETVQGDSMTGILENWQKIVVLKGYYRCNDMKRGDIVIYPYAGNPVPIVKSVKAISGDRFAIRKNTDNLWNILVNDAILKTSDGIPYTLSEAKSKMLGLYADSYHGIVPADTCLILGNLPNGTMDSTRFGLVNRIDLIGKMK